MGKPDRRWRRREHVRLAGDKYGLSWQVVPRILGELMGDDDREKVKRVTEAMLSMRKIEIAELQRAYEG